MLFAGLVVREHALLHGFRGDGFGDAVGYAGVETTVSLRIRALFRG
jgi:hypothetical protein